MSSNDKAVRFKNEGPNKDKGGRGKNCYYRKSYGDRKNTTKSCNKYRSTDFQGGTSELKGFYFDVMHTGQAEGYNKTKKEILQFIERKNSTGPLVKQSLDAGQLMLDDLPVAQTAEALVATPVLKIYTKRR